MKRLSLVAGIIMALVMAVPVFAHHVAGIVGTVDCQGAYLIQVQADVFGGVHLVVTLDGVTISDAAVNGPDGGVLLYSFTGTGASAGEAITAKTSDNETVVSSTLTANPAECVTITPSPSPSPTPTPTKTPRVTAPPSLPATNTGETQDPANNTWVFLFGGIAAAAVVVLIVTKPLRK